VTSSKADRLACARVYYSAAYKTRAATLQPYLIEHYDLFLDDIHIFTLAKQPLRPLIPELTDLHCLDPSDDELFEWGSHLVAVGWWPWPGHGGRLPRGRELRPLIRSEHVGWNEMERERLYYFLCEDPSDDLRERIMKVFTEKGAGWKAPRNQSSLDSFFK
jgi:hypothetical protein